MADPKRYTFYRPRIQIPVETMATSPGEYRFYCLPVDGAEALLRIAPYLKREITYVGEVIDDKRYIGPSTVDFGAIVDLVGELEVSLMSSCGIEELTALIEAQNATLLAMQECICLSTEWQRQAVSGSGDVSGYVQEGNVTYKNVGDALANPLPPGTDEIRCAYAQAFYWYVFTMFTEEILPAANSTADTITAAIVATATFAGVASFVGMPIAVLTGIVAAVVAWGIDGAIAEFTNWLYASIDDMVCIMYTWFPDFDGAAAALAAYVDAAPEPSFLDKAVLKTVLCSPWHMGFVVQDQQENATWDAYITSGFCTDCDPTPPGCFSIGACNLADWTGGANSCMGGYAVHQGSTSYWNKTSWTCPPAGATMRVGWIPRTDGSAGSPVCKLGARRLSDSTSYVEFETPARPKDVLVEETFSLSSQLWGELCEFGVRQVGWWAEIKYFCVDEV